MLSKTTTKLRLLKSITLTSFCLAAAIAFSASAQNNTKDSQQTSEETKQLNKKIDELLEREHGLTQRLEKQSNEIAGLKAQIDASLTMPRDVAVILALILTLGTGVSLIGWFKSDRRAAEAHKYTLESAKQSDQRTVQSFSLAVAGESAAQNRAAEVHETFLEGSKQTLDLVNATLELAKEASERAAKFIERKARAMVEDLDSESRRLLANVPKQDDRALIADPDRRSKLRSVAQKITGFEQIRLILPEEVQLKPPSLFIRGMDFHLGQQYDDAIENWHKVALPDKVEDDLRSLAWYWIGYEQNNLLRFKDAEQSFQNALECATGERRYELERIVIETRFFNKGNLSYNIQDCIQRLENLLAEIEDKDELEHRKNKVIITLGNVISQRGYELFHDGKTEEAIVMFEKAKGHYEKVAADKWAAYGKAEMLFALDHKGEAKKIFRERVRPDVIEEAVRREEPRSKVLARTTELICCLLVEEWEHEAFDIRNLVLQELGRVDGRLTVYSQMQKRNVSKDEFQDDLDKLMYQLNKTHKDVFEIFGGAYLLKRS